MTSLSSLFGAKGNGTGLASTGIKTAHYTAQPNQCVSTDTAAGSITVTLPASPDHGDIVAIVDAARTWGVHALTVDGNGTTIDGAAGNKAFAVPGSYVELRYDANTDDWQLLLTPEIPVQAGNGGKFLQTDGSAASWAEAPSITQTPPVYLTSGGSTTLTAKSVVAAYEQIAGTTFNLTYNAESDYVQEDAANGTDLTGGAFVLHNTAGAVIDSNTKLLIHADGLNGDTAIIDERGITPFGTGCMYFDGSSYFKVPSSHKVAFGASQDFTIECWINIAFLGGGANQFAWDLRSTDFSSGISLRITENSGVWPPTGPYRFRLLGWNNTINVGPGSGTFNLNTWCHVAVVRNSGVLKLYVDGVEAASVADTNAYTAQALVLGGNATGTAGAFIEGWMSNFRVSKKARYTGAFTRPSVEFTRDPDTVYLFKGYDGHGSHLIRDDSRSGKPIRLVNTLSSTKAKFGSTSARSTTGAGGGCIYGGNPYDADYNVADHDFTLDFWVNLDTQPTAGCLFCFGYEVEAGLSLYGTGVAGQFQLKASNTYSSYNLSGPTITLLANTWHHVAVTRNGANIHLFLDGVSAGALAIGSGVAATKQSGSYMGAFTLGNALTGGNGGGVAGYFDELRFKKGECAWTAGFIPATSAYALTDDRTVLLLHFEGASNDKVTLDSSESSYGNWIGSETTIPVIQFAGATLGTTYTRGGHGTSLVLNGSGQYAQHQYASPTVGTPYVFWTWEQFCLEAWVYFTSVSTVQYIFDFYDTGAPAEILALYAQANGTVVASVNGSPVATSAATLSVGWNHVALIREGRGWTVAVNGNISSYGSPQLNVTYYGGTVYSYLGMRYTSANYVGGAFDAIRLTRGKPRYTANFTPATLTHDDDTTLLWTFDGSVGQKWVKELSKNTATVSATNARTVRDGRFLTPMITGQNICINTSSPKFGTGRVSSGGPTGNSLTIPFTYEMLPPGDFTFDLWMLPSGYQKQIMEFRNGSPQRWCMYLTAAGKLEFFYSDTTQASITVTSTTTISSSVWTHIAVVRTAGLLKLYVNGVQEASVTATNGLYQDTAGTVFLFSATGGQNTFSGALDEIRISNTARWTSNFTVPTIPYGQQYVTGPYYVTTSNTSRIDVSAFSSIDSVAVAETLNPGTTIKYLASFDGRSSWYGKNPFLYPEDWTNAAWTNTNGVVVTNGQMAPDGTTTAVKLDDQSAGSVGILTQNVTITADTATRTYSVYLKAGSSSLCRVVCGVGAVPFWLNLSTGTVVSYNPGATYVSHSLTAVGGGWYRLTCVETNDGTGTNTRIRVSPALDSSNTASLTGYLYVWRPRLDIGSTASASTVPVTLAKSGGLADLEKLGMTSAELQAALTGWVPSLGTTIDVAASLKTANQTFTPVLDNIMVTMDEYQAVRMIDDVSVRRVKAGGAQAHKLTRVKAGNANMVFDCVT